MLNKISSATQNILKFIQGIKKMKAESNEPRYS